MNRPAESNSAHEPVGLIGVGLVGTALVERLRLGGRQVVGWDLASDRMSLLSQLGGVPAQSAARVFAACERVVLSLPTLGVVENILREVSSVLRAGQIVLDTTTGAPDQTVALATDLARRGVVYLDATISGSSAQVRAGDVTLMVGGAREAYERCQDLFAAFANKVIHTGASGSGTKMKLVTNLVMGLNRAALAEGLILARALGLEPQQALEVLRQTMAYSRVMDTKGEKMVQGNFEPQARLSQHLKDVRTMLAAAAEAEQTLPLTETHRKLLEFAESLGLGPLDNSAVLRAIEQFRK